MKGTIIKTVDETVNDIIEGTINTWEIIAKEDCDLKWQLKLMVSRCLEEIGRDITNERKAQSFIESDRARNVLGRKEYFNGKEILVLEYKCLFGISHRVVGDNITELIFNLTNHKCECPLNTV